MYYNKKNILYRSVNGRSNVHLSRLRMGLSGLNVHRFSYNFIDSPNCTFCNFHREDIVHYFFNCPKHAAHRGNLLNQLALLLNESNINPNVLEISHNIASDLMLNGSEHLSLQQNIAIFKIVQEFILLSKRFL